MQTKVPRRKSNKHLSGSNGSIRARVAAEEMAKLRNNSNLMEVSGHIDLAHR